MVILGGYHKMRESLHTQAILRVNMILIPHRVNSPMYEGLWMVYDPNGIKNTSTSSNTHTLYKERIGEFSPEF